MYTIVFYENRNQLGISLGITTKVKVNKLVLELRFPINGLTLLRV
jgi:hypothetical protein